MNTETLPVQDSRQDTIDHINRVRGLLSTCCLRLDERASVHDASKLEEPEKSAFDRLKALSLSGMAYGSDEYRACLRKEKTSIDHHYAHNSHHPEFYPKKNVGVMAEMLRAMAAAQKEQAEAAMESEPDAAKVLIDVANFVAASADHLESSVNGMSLFDVLEMLMDWKAATERMKNGGDINSSLVINTKRFALSPQLASILANTIREMKW